MVVVTTLIFLVGGKNWLLLSRNPSCVRWETEVRIAFLKKTFFVTEKVWRVIIGGSFVRGDFGSQIS